MKIIKNPFLSINLSVDSALLGCYDKYVNIESYSLGGFTSITIVSVVEFIVGDTLRSFFVSSFRFFDKKDEVKSMLSMFKKKKVALHSPVNGRMIPIEEAPDEVFRSKMMGDGAAFIFEDGKICAPCDGKIAFIPSTLHAFGMTTANQAEILVHIGLDTVDLNGEGFEQLVKQGATVKQGMPILKVDIPFMKEQGIDLTTPMVLTNSNDFSLVFQEKFGTVTTGQTVIECTKK